LFTQTFYTSRSGGISPSLGRCITQIDHGVSMGSSNEQHWNFKIGNQSQFYNKSAPIITLQSHSVPSSFKSVLRLESKTNTTGSISMKEVNERSKGIFKFCGEEWDKNHLTKCKVWGKLNAIFVSQDQMGEEDESNKDVEMDLITQVWICRRIRKYMFLYMQFKEWLVEVRTVNWYD